MNANEALDRLKTRGTLRDGKMAKDSILPTALASSSATALNNLVVRASCRFGKAQPVWMALSNNLELLP